MINIEDYKNAERVFYYFEEISKIPHGSENTAKIADYLVNFAKERNLWFARDEYNNVIIRKDATKGFEDKPTVIFQGHTDMVALKEPGCPIDMEKEGVELYRDGDFLRARGTTLGGDDGVAIAYALAVLESDEIEHPEFEAVFTSDEEIGLIGAGALDASLLHGKMLINIDSDEEGIFTAGCAGGARVDFSIPVKKKTRPCRLYTLTVSGLLGGHSGVEIDKGRANAVKLVSDILSELTDVRLSSFEAGSADNAIPSNATVSFATKSSVFEIAEVISDVEAALPKAESGARFKIDTSFSFARVMSKEDSANIISFVSELPTGVMKMSEDIEGLVETSLNIGIVKLSASEFELTASVRSAKAQEKANLIERLRKIAENYGVAVGVRGEYPAWEYKKDSHLREVMSRVYTEKYGKAPEVIIIHAGLECGIFSDKIEGLDSVSIGPDNFDIHTPNEHLSISSTARVWDFLITVLKEI